MKDCFTWLGSLSNLYLQLIGIHHELGRDTKSAGSHLLDAGGDGVSLLQPLEVGEGGGQALLIHICQVLPAERVFATLTRVALACMMLTVSQVCKFLAQIGGSNKQEQILEFCFEGKLLSSLALFKKDECIPEKAVLLSALPWSAYAA